MGGVISIPLTSPCASRVILQTTTALLLPCFSAKYRQDLGLSSLTYNGPFTNYFGKISAFFDQLPTSVDIFYHRNVDKNQQFWTTYPPPLVNVVCEQPLMRLRS